MTGSLAYRFAFLIFLSRPWHCLPQPAAFAQDLMTPALRLGLNRTSFGGRMMRFPPSWMSLLILPPGGDSGLDGQVRISIFAVPGRNLTVRERNTHRPLGDPGSFSSVPGGRLDFCSFLGFRRCPFSHDEDMQRAGATLNSAFAASEGRQAVLFCLFAFFLSFPSLTDDLP